jgi:sugar phosphate isomerase/epimerase
MRLNLLKSLWGVVKIDGGRKSLAEALDPLARQGYTGVECSVRLAHELNTIGEFVSLMNHHSLQWVPILFSSGPVDGSWDPFLLPNPITLKNPKPKRFPTASHGDSVACHTAAIAGQADAASTLGVPIPFFNSHTGHASMPIDKAEKLFQQVDHLERGLGVHIVHEIHRGRSTYSPWILAEILPRLPYLKLVADYAHFTCVGEVAPGACLVFEDALKLIRPHIRHIHARVGYENGPQVPDPRAPEWSPYTKGFEDWWDEIWVDQAAQGLQV